MAERISINIFKYTYYFVKIDKYNKHYIKKRSFRARPDRMRNVFPQAIRTRNASIHSCLVIKREREWEKERSRMINRSITLLTRWAYILGPLIDSVIYFVGINCWSAFISDPARLTSKQVKNPTSSEKREGNGRWRGERDKFASDSSNYVINWTPPYDFFRLLLFISGDTYLWRYLLLFFDARPSLFSSTQSREVPTEIRFRTLSMLIMTT